MRLFYIQFDQFLVLSSQAKIKKSTGSLGQDVAIIRTLLEEKGQKNCLNFILKHDIFGSQLLNRQKNISLKDNRTRVMDISTSKIIRFSKAFYCCCCLAPSSSCCFLSSNIPLVVVLIQQTSVFSELSVACKSSIWHCRTMTVITDPTHGRVLFRTNRYE